jgi:HxlR-like helix-turn-helix
MSNKNYTPDSAAQDVEAAPRLLEGRWKLVILFHLFGGKILRFSDLERVIPNITQKMLGRSRAQNTFPSLLRIRMRPGERMAKNKDDLSIKSSLGVSAGMPLAWWRLSDLP